MDTDLPGDQLLLFAGVLLAMGVVAVGWAQRLKTPALLVFLAIGMAIGSDGLGWVEVGFDDLALVQTVATAALVLILYEGGLSTPLAAFRRVWAPGLTLATVGVVITAGVAGAAAYLVLDVSRTTAVLVGAVIASTDAAAVFSAMRNAPLPSRTRQLLQVESGLNDPAAILLTIGAIEAWRSSPSGLDWLAFGVVQLGGGVLIGFAVAAVGVRVLNRAELASASAYPVLALALAGIAYGLGAAVGASGFLAVYVTGLTVGAAVPRHQRLIRNFHDGLGSVAEIGLFLLLGLLVFPSDLPTLAPEGLAIAAVLLVVARPLAVALCLPWFSLPKRETAVVAWAGLRGAVPIVLATFPLAADHPDGALIFDIVFFVVLVSVAVQGLTVSSLATRLGLHDDSAPWDGVVDVVPLDQVEGDLVEIELGTSSPVAGRALATCPLPEGTRITAVVRGPDVSVPNGATVLEAGDRLLLISAGDAPIARLRAWAHGAEEAPG